MQLVMRLYSTQSNFLIFIKIHTSIERVLCIARYLADQFDTLVYLWFVNPLLFFYRLVYQRACK